MNGNVLLISPSFKGSTGGVQKLMQEIVSRSYYKFTILTEESGECSNAKRMRIKGVIGIIKVNIYIWNKRDKIDLVYVSTARRLHLLLLPIILGMGTICHAHGRDLYLSYSSFKEIVQGALAALLRRLSVQFIAVSKWTEEQLIEMGVSKSRVQVVPNGVDVDRFRNGDGSDIRRKYDVKKDEFLLLTVARIDPRKGHRLVIEALKYEEDCRYLIVGKGEFEENLRKLASNINVLDRVIFAGYISDNCIPKVYHACDLFVMPSEHFEDSNNVEGFGISFLEANAAGKAVIGTQTGGIPTAVKHKENGYLCEPNKDSVLKAIREIKNNKDVRKKIENNAIKWAEKHDWSRVVGGIDSIIKEEIKSKY